MPATHDPIAFLTLPADLRLSVEQVGRTCLAEPGTSILESSRFDKLDGRYSYFCFDPIAEVSGDPRRNLESLFGQLVRITPEVIIKPNPQASQPEARTPFRGGWVGFIGYEPAAELAGVHCAMTYPRRRAAGFSPCGMTPAEDSAQQGHRSSLDIPLPLNSSAPGWMFRLYDTLLIRDNGNRQWMFAGIEWPASRFPSRPPLTDRIERLRRRLESAARSFTSTQQPIAGILTQDVPVPGAIETSLSLGEYHHLVRRAIDYIAAGDVFQVNLAQRFMCRTHRTPAEHYLRLRRANPSCYAAYLPFTDGVVISSSPELFLDLRAGRVRTKPIKGTRPRCGDDTLNTLAIRSLETSEKDTAELTMIVDLLRNDLGRVCRPGSINVTIPHAIESHPTVFHRVSTIEGTLEERCDWRDLLRATLPGGSITGAPKIRAMQIIRELEPVPRGPYCGCSGYIGLDGSMMMNIAIRTMVQQGDVVSFHAGGAILAESDAAQEYEEILAKARGMLSAVSLDEVEYDQVQTLGASAT